MNLLRLLNPAKHLQHQGVLKRKLIVRSKVDEMRRDMGLPAIKWGRLR